MTRRHAAGALLLATSIYALTAASALANNGDPDYLVYDGGMTLEGPGGPGAPDAPGSSIGLGLKGISQMDVRALHGGFSEIPPDTNGAVGATQFMETTNGAYAIYDKATGARQLLIGDGAFWAAAGQPASNGFAGFSNGDSRILYDNRSQRWIVESFGASLSDIQIAVSDTSDALGPWKSTVFTAYSPAGSQPIADYPTLAIDSKAVYIGTNDFDKNLPAGHQFAGTTLSVIARSDLVGAGAPSTVSLKEFFTAFPAGDVGFAIQGVNQVGGSDRGQIFAVAANDFGPVAYKVNNPGTAGATETAAVFVDQTPYDPNALAVQPDGTRNVDTLDDRFSGAAWEYNGKIYEVHTITPTGAAHTSLELYVVDAASKAVVQKTLIGDGVHDFFQGSLAINNSGQVVVGYNESGADMNVSFYAATYNQLVGGGGALVSTGVPILLKVSPINNYHNNSTQFSPASGRQRWGDYSQVTVDPNNQESFWLIGEYALGYLPSSTASFSRWGTWISNINIANVPEPGTWAMMLLGMGLIGGSMRRRRVATV